MIDSVFSDAQMPQIGDDRKAKINPLSKNFEKKEFQELWGRINQKAAYTVHFETAELIGKCVKGVFDYDYAQFDALPAFEMSPLSTVELESLAERIMETHGDAYGWEPDVVMKASDLDALVLRSSSIPVQDRSRHTITSVVKFLDRLLEDQT